MGRPGEHKDGEQVAINFAANDAAAEEARRLVAAMGSRCETNRADGGYTHVP